MKKFLLARQLTAGIPCRQKLSGVLAGMVILVLGFPALQNEAQAQTRLDLGKQTKNVDFSTAAKTLPAKTGTALPAQCITGEMYFKTNATAGGNLYGCVATDTWSKQGGDALPPSTGLGGTVLSTDGTQSSWTALSGDVSGPVGGNAVVKIQGRPVANTAPQSGQTLVWNSTSARWEPQTASGGGGGSLTIAVDGAVVGSRGTLNLQSGFGSNVVGIDTGSIVQAQFLADTAVLQTKTAVQSGGTVLCASAGGNVSTYICSMSPTLTTYTVGMVVYWQPDVNSAAGATLNIDALGASPLRKADGTGIGAGELAAGQLYGLWYDGSGFRVLSGSSGGGGGNTLGTLSQVWYPFGNGGSSRNTRMAMTAGRSYWFRFTPDRTRQVRRFAVPLYPWNGTSDTLAIGIFDSTGTKVAECNTRAAGISPSGAMVICTLGAAVTVTMDTEYQLSIGSETASPQLDCTADSLAYELHTLWSAQPGYFPGSKALAGYGANSATGSGTGFALPATLGAETSAAQCAPQVIFLP